jgi:predicted phosphoadenosine phosphosulfate sulfurtransferase
MDGRISDAQRQAIWEGLSDVFVDNEINYDYIAWKVGDVAINLLEEIFFNEVAPVCGPNAMEVIPPVWACFDPEDLAKCIREMQMRNQKSLFARLKHRIAVKFYRLRFGGYWKEVVAELEKRRQKTT